MYTSHDVDSKQENIDIICPFESNTGTQIRTNVNKWHSDRPRCHTWHKVSITTLLITCPILANILWIANSRIPHTPVHTRNDNAQASCLQYSCTYHIYLLFNIFIFICIQFGELLFKEDNLSKFRDTDKYLIRILIMRVYNNEIMILQCWIQQSNKIYN